MAPLSHRVNNKAARSLRKFGPLLLHGSRLVVFVQLRGSKVCGKFGNSDLWLDAARSRRPAISKCDFLRKFHVLHVLGNLGKANALFVFGGVPSQARLVGQLLRFSAQFCSQHSSLCLWDWAENRDFPWNSPYLGIVMKGLLGCHL